MVQWRLKTRSIDLMYNDVTRLDPGKIKQFKMATIEIFPVDDY